MGYERRRWRRGLERTEILIGVGVVLVLGLLAVPVFTRMARKSAREELPLIVDEIRKFEIAYQKPFGEYVSAPYAPRAPHAVDGERAAWATNAGYEKLGFSPIESLGADELYGTYRVAITASGFTVTGTADIDGDGERSVYVATESEPAHPTTDPNVY
jgi:hypothetical protein